MKYEVIIGLEIHVQLKTKSKMFCRCANERIEEPNKNICPVCMGHPGTLPFANKQAIEWTIMCGQAMGSVIGSKSSDRNSEDVVSKFDRKNYFYPDLPKGYQISQFDQPLCNGGSLEINVNGETKKLNLERIHLEEDAGKNIHVKGRDESLVDYNRAGVPLMEIVTKPDFSGPDEAKIFLQELRKLLRYIGVSNADMEKGQLRCDANISLRKPGEDKLYPKTEIKNMNSFKAVRDALEYEIKRQTELWDEGNPPDIQSTRGWDEGKGITREMRGKEEAEDYRYFPEPDLPLFTFSKSYLRALNDALPELPWDKKKRFLEQFGLDEKEVETLTAEIGIAEFYENALSEAREWHKSTKGEGGISDEEYKKIAKLTSNWLSSKLMALLKDSKKNIEQCKITPENFAELAAMIYEKKINSKVAQDVLKEMFETGGDPSNIVDEKGLSQVSDEGELDQIVDKIISDNPKPVEDYKSGNENVMQFLIGRVMAETKGKANPEVLRGIFEKKLI